MKPQVFTLLDFVTIGIMSIVAGGADIASWMSDVPFPAKILMTVVSLIFFGIYISILIARKISINSCDFFTEDGFGIINNSKSIITKGDIDNEIQRTKNLWAPIISWATVHEVLDKPYLIVFEDGVGKDPRTGNKIAGITISSKFSVFSGKIIIYKMDELTIETSALSHEIGHLMYAGKYGIFDNDKTHKFMSDNHLP
jgi:hypothetical protein